MQVRDPRCELDQGFQCDAGTPAASPGHEERTLSHTPHTHGVRAKPPEHCDSVRS